MASKAFSRLVHLTKSFNSSSCVSFLHTRAELPRPNMASLLTMKKLSNTRIMSPNSSWKHTEDAGNMHLLTKRTFTNVSTLSSSGNISLGPPTGTFYFDTHKLVTSLQSQGFTLQQSEAIANSLTQVISTGTDSLSKYMVSRNELAQLEIRMNATIEALRKDMVILEKSEFLMLKHENENLKAEVTQLGRQSKDELLKLRSSLALDLSLEKGRTKEESSIHEQKIKDTNNRIDTEIARVKMEMEAQKLDLIKYLAGTFFSVVTLVIAWWRFVKM